MNNNKAVEFTFITENKDQLEKMVMDLQAKCNENSLELRQGRFIGSFREVSFPDGTHQFRATLHIVKREGFTYNQIYGLVNSIKACPFKTVSLNKISFLSSETGEKTMTNHTIQDEVRGFESAMHYFENSGKHFSKEAVLQFAETLRNKLSKTGKSVWAMGFYDAAVIIARTRESRNSE